MAEKYNRRNGQNGRETDDASRRALRSEAAGRVYGKHGGYRNLKAYQLSDMLYDYNQKHLTRRKLPIWEQGDALFEEARALHPKTVEDAAAWVNQTRKHTEERAANLGAILTVQAHFLTERLLDRQARDFEKEGGFSERLYKARSSRWRGGKD